MAHPTSDDTATPTAAAPDTAYSIVSFLAEKHIILISDYSVAAYSEYNETTARALDIRLKYKSGIIEAD